MSKGVFVAWARAAAQLKPEGKAPEALSLSQIERQLLWKGLRKRGAKLLDFVFVEHVEYLYAAFYTWSMGWGMWATYQRKGRAVILGYFASCAIWFVWQTSLSRQRKAKADALRAIAALTRDPLSLLAAAFNGARCSACEANMVSAVSEDKTTLTVVCGCARAMKFRAM